MYCIVVLGVALTVGSSLARTDHNLKMRKIQNYGLLQTFPDFSTTQVVQHFLVLPTTMIQTL